MDDKILFYIILGVLYFLFSRLKKKKPEEVESEQTEDNRPQSGRPVTFEELLREITESKQQSVPPPQPQVPSAPSYSAPPSREYKQYESQPPVYEDYDDNIEDEVKSREKTRTLERSRVEQERVNKIYEEAKQLAFNRPSLEEDYLVDRPSSKYEKFEQFEEKQGSGVAKELQKELRDPKSIKRALVLNEVLNRRHF